jgi:hypothetical protein
MRIASGLFRLIGIPILAACIIFPAATGTPAQNADPQRKSIVIKVTDADKTAAGQADVVFLKAFSGNKHITSAPSKLVTRGTGQHTAASSKDSEDSEDNRIRFPGDLQYHNGKVVEFAESHNIYMLPNGSCPISTCWGDPESFLRDLGQSEFIHVTDQYVGERASNRYTLGESASISFTPSSTPLTDDDMIAVVHAVASATGDTGYRHIYHVFLPAGQDECIDPTFQICASNFFCAYHSSVTFKGDIGHVLYSVEPYANVLGCQVRPGTPNGTLIDSTNNVLSHELIETITDPDGNAWWNSKAGGLFGEEIGDECIFVRPPFSVPSIISVHGRRYALQPEYDNGDHGCTADQ